MINRGRWHLTACFLSALALLGGGACSVYEESKLNGAATKPPDTGRDAGMDSATPPDGDGSMTSDAKVPPGCVPQTEMCNGVDDDCDKTVDETKAATADCAERRPNAIVMCGSGICFSSGCKPGFLSQDGKPENGCEAKCTPALCDDAGAEDGGTL